MIDRSAKSQRLKRMASVMIAAAMFFELIAMPAEAVRADNTYADGVTEEMCSADYWIARADKPKRVLMNIDEIAELNAAMLAEKAAAMYDLENMDPACNIAALQKSLSSGDTYPAKKTLYINGELLADREAYFDAMKANIASGGAVNTDAQGAAAGYTVCVERAEQRAWPTADYLGYSEKDSDDEFVLAALNVNEPFLVKFITADKKFCWGYTTNCTGWVETDKLALCADKEQWLESWKATDDNILVVTQDKIALERSFYEPQTSGVELMLGTMLKLVPKDEIPSKIGVRGTWYNHVVYLPTRDGDGKYVRKITLVAKHYNVSIGYPPLTQENLIKVMMSCLGNRYGWGGMIGAMDCSFYTRSVYRCFGLEIPRNTTWQQAIPGCKTDISGMTDEEKKELIGTLPAGALLYFSGHTMIYLGRVDGRDYVISALGSLYDVEDTALRTVNSVSINSLDVRRGNGKTWLTNLSAIVRLESPESAKSPEDGTGAGVVTGNVTGAGVVTGTGAGAGTVTGTGGGAQTADKKLPGIENFCAKTQTDKTITLKWKKNANAAGYQIEKYDASAGKWKPAKKIADPDTLSCRIAGLKASGGYRFRICALGASGSIGAYSPVLCAYTSPSKVVGLKIGGRTKKSITLKWKKNSSAAGYEIYKREGGKWVMLKKITRKTQTTYKVAKLSSGKLCRFRVRAYKKNGAKTYFGSYALISGKTR